jgi:hypothetical protein
MTTHALSATARSALWTSVAALVLSASACGNHSPSKKKGTTTAAVVAPQQELFAEPDLVRAAAWNDIRKPQQYTFTLAKGTPDHAFGLRRIAEPNPEGPRLPPVSLEAPVDMAEVDQEGDALWLFDAEEQVWTFQVDTHVPHDALPGPYVFACRNAAGEERTVTVRVAVPRFGPRSDGDPEQRALLLTSDDPTAEQVANNAILVTRPAPGPSGQVTVKPVTYRFTIRTHGFTPESPGGVLPATADFHDPEETGAAPKGVEVSAQPTLDGGRTPVMVPLHPLVWSPQARAEIAEATGLVLEPSTWVRRPNGATYTFNYFLASNVAPGVYEVRLRGARNHDAAATLRGSHVAVAKAFLVVK